MRLKCDRTSLVDKLNMLARGVSTRSALPVLSGILLQARRGVSSCTRRTWRSRSRRRWRLTVERDGEAVVPARLFTDVVKNLSAEEVRGRSSRTAVGQGG